MSTNPPSFLNAEDFARVEFTNLDLNNPETLDIFSDLNWVDNADSSHNHNASPQTIAQPISQHATPQIVAQPITQPSQPLITTSTPPISQPTNIQDRIVPMSINVPELSDTISVTNSLKKDIIKYLYNSNSCDYLKNCFAKVEDIDATNDQVLYKKFKLGLVLDSMIGKNSSDKNLAKYVFTFFEVLLSEARKFMPADVHKYIDVFSESMAKDKITILNDSGLGNLSNVLTSNNLDDMIKSLVSTDSPSLRALKSSLQNISLLVSLALSKKMFTPFLGGLFSKAESDEPPKKKFRPNES